MHSPRDIKLSKTVIVIHLCFVASRYQNLLNLLQSVTNQSWIEASFGCLVIIKQYVFDWLLTNNKATLHFAYCSLETHPFPPVHSLQLLHFGNENIVSLLLYKLVLINTLRYLSWQLSPFLGVFGNVKFCKVNGVLNVLCLLLKVTERLLSGETLDLEG